VCCEHEDGPHEIDPRTPAGKDASYTLRTLRTWATTIAPTVQTTAAIAKGAAPLITLLLTGVAVHLHGTARKDVHAAATHLGKIPGHLPLLDQTPGTPTMREITTPTPHAPQPAASEAYPPHKATTATPSTFAPPTHPPDHETNPQPHGKTRHPSATASHHEPPADLLRRRNPVWSDSGACAW